jgi:UDP-N-acetylmuramoyl-L-alanyl-D-glutamate--2,6-diaminopimelate ligase
MEKLLFKIKKLIPRKLFASLQPVYHFVLSWVSAVIYRFPSEKMIVIGVTGTTGKTTSTYLIAKTLAGAGFRVGYTSTAMFGDGDMEWLNDKKMTMPGRFYIQKTLAAMTKNKCQFAVVETTSEGVRQFRHRFINYDTLIFTGLYPEHIESHGSFENYRAAKGELFAHLKRGKTKYADEHKQVVRMAGNLKKLDLDRVKKKIIANLDDSNAAYFLDFWAEEKFGYTFAAAKPREGVEVWSCGDIRVGQSGVSFRFSGQQINLGILGAFNAANAVHALGVGLTEGFKLEHLRPGLEAVNGVPGRLERIDCGQDFLAIVDYAFEPNAVAKLHETVEALPHNKIIHVLGAAGGGRDSARRPLLGKLAGERADVVIITNEDPYDEDPELIISQVLAGAEKAGKKNNDNLFKIMDRRDAIAKAISLAEAGDIVLITGKGSEQAICLANGEKMPWDDRTVVREEISKV